LADCDEDAMVEEWGERACTVCFPAAPTNPLYNRPARIDREAQETKAAEKAAKQADKDAKAITFNGMPVRVNGDVFRTKVAARNELSRQIQNGIWYGPNAEAIVYLAQALEAAGVEWVPVAQRAFKKAVKEATGPGDFPWVTEEMIAEAKAETALRTTNTRLVLQGLGVAV
jgi:hypothetical protein